MDIDLLWISAVFLSFGFAIEGLRLCHCLPRLSIWSFRLRSAIAGLLYPAQSLRYLPGRFLGPVLCFADAYGLELAEEPRFFQNACEG